MLRRVSLFAILVFALAACSLSASAQQQFRIAGTVVDSISGLPIERAEVSIAPVSNLDEAATTLSSSSGQFVFAGPAPGKYRLLASRVGYTQQGLDQHEGFMTALAVGPRLDSEHIRFRLFRESVIAGTVLDEFGEPVRNAEIFLFHRGFEGGARATQLAGRAATDDLGDYRFPHLAPGSYFVVAYAKPWYSTGAQIRVSHATVLNRTIRDVGGGGDAISSDSDGQPEVRFEPPPAPNPIRDVVYPLSFYSNASSLDSSTPLTLSSGTNITADFSLHPIPALRILVKASAAAAEDVSSGYANRRHPEVLVSPPVGASLELPGVSIEQLPVHPVPQMPGYFEVTDVAPGEISFRSTGRNEAGYTLQSTRRQVTSETPVDLSSSVSVSLSGTVDPVPSPHPGISAGIDGSQAFLLLTSADGRSTFSAAITAKGEFALAVSAGKYTVTLTPPEFFHIASVQATGQTNGAEISGHTLSLPPGASVKLSIRSAQANATVSGVALKNGRPFAGAMLVLVPEDSTQSATLFHRDQSDSDGTFTMTPILPGRYTLLAIENGWDLEWSKLSVLFPYLTAGVPIEVKPAASVSANPKVQ
jgi:hypothetical protein